MTVYVVTDGQYSDYHIVAVFGDKSEAEKCIELYGDGNIEEYELGKRAEDVMWWYAKIDDDGTMIGQPRPQTGDMWEPTSWAPPGGIRYAFGTTGTRDRGWHRGVGRTPDAAIKSARDQMTRSKAERAGITP